eukprot:1156350-Pelagomonas_calceolata.AAC.10
MSLWAHRLRKGASGSTSTNKFTLRAGLGSRSPQAQLFLAFLLESEKEKSVVMGTAILEGLWRGHDGRAARMSQ